MNPLPSLHVTRQGPGTDLLSFAFEGPTVVDQQQPLYVDAEDTGRSINGSQLRSLVRRLIAGLQANGLRKGDAVVVNLANNILYSALYFAIIGAGGVYVGINPASREFELQHYLELTAPKYILTQPDGLAKTLSAAATRSIPSDHIYVVDAKSFPLDHDDELPPTPPISPWRKNSFSDSGEHELQQEHRHRHRHRHRHQHQQQQQNLSDLLQHGQADWIRFSDETIAKATPAAMYLTSGTSGPPKAAILSHYATVCQHLSIQPEPAYQIRRLMTLPFFHIFAALFVHILPIRHGQPLYILPRFHLQQYVDSIEKLAITDTLMAPPMVHAVINSGLPLQPMLDSVRYIGVGGAPIDAATMQKLQDVLHPTATLSQVWGMTEIGAAMLHQYPHQGHLGSIGSPVPGYEMRLLLSSSGQPITTDHTPGELQVRYSGIMSGYKSHPPVESGSWYSTGDIMTRIAGRYYVVGRSKELIKVNGFQVSPAELEATLLTHPGIADAAVIGVPISNDDEATLTEAPRAFIILKESSHETEPPLTAAAIHAYTSARLTSYKRLTGGIVFLHHIPRTPSGKIQRFKLAQQDSYRHEVNVVLLQTTETLVKSVEEEVVPTTTRRSQRLKRKACEREVEEVAYKKIATTLAGRRRRGMTLQAKMEALERGRLLN